MKKSVYNTENVPPCCIYCLFGNPAPDGESMLCTKKGVVAKDFSCKKFKYDIMKRVPKKAPKLQSFSQEDFSI